MTTDFYDAFERHKEDAETLFSMSRWANSDHLFGIAAECGLKRLMLAFGMGLDTSSNDMPQLKVDHVHANKVWDRYEHYRAGYGATKYILSSPNPFGDWDASQRYSAQSNFDKARVEPHKKACKEIEDICKKAQLDGII